MRQFLLAAALIGATLAGTAGAADGALDDTFGTDAEFPGYGFYVNPNGTPNFSLDYVGAIVKRPDGKIWVVGRMKAPGAYRLSLTRTDANGYPDMEFGDSGLRTVVAPCPDFNVSDATLDAQGRLVVAVNDCADFTVYRFLPNGDLDLTLAGSGVLSVPFNQGGGDEDRSQRYLVAAFPLETTALSPCEICDAPNALIRGSGRVSVLYTGDDLAEAERIYDEAFN